ncbi:MAG: hypothetical protein K2J72_00530 [Oscillospiraceae bacterium]|nr:hypothetical protein [Oscillospiraceae bacterium]
MKKFLAAILSLSLCGVMLAGCGGNGTDSTVSDETTSAAADMGAAEADTEEKKDETEAAAEAETEAETEADTEAEADDGAAVVGGSYDSVDAFAKDSSVFSLPTETVSAGDSLTYNFVRTLEGATEFYMDVEATDGSMAMIMALSGKEIYMKMSGSAAEENATLIIKDSVMYMLDDSTKSGYYFAADEDVTSEYNVEEMLSEIDMDKEIEDAEDVKVCKVDIGGKTYTFEVAETGGGFLFDGDELYAIINSESDADFNALIVHEFSGNVPSGIFELPSDYELIDLMEALSE